MYFVCWLWLYNDSVLESIKKLKLSHKGLKDPRTVSALIVVVIMAATGVHFLFGSDAATPYVTGSAANGTRSGTTSLVTGNSSAQAVQFGGAASSGCPAGETGTPPNCVISTNNGVVAGNLENVLFDEDSTDYDWATTAPMYSYIVMNPWNFAWIPAIKAANPTVKVLEYKDLNSARPSACSLESEDQEPTGVGYCFAKANDPSWFLTAQTASQNTSNCGGTMAEIGYPDNCELDPENPAYQQLWLTNVVQDATAHSWDGIFIDNAINNGSYGYSTAYPTDATIQASVLSMIKAVGPGLIAHGLIALVNMGGYSTQYPNFWGELLPYVSGGNQEYYLSWSSTPDVTTVAGWQVYENEASDCAAAKKICTFNVGSAAITQQTVDYTAASLLLYSNGYGLFSEADGGTFSFPGEPELGPATDTAHLVGSNYVRDFTNGNVTVDVTDGIGTITTN